VAKQKQRRGPATTDPSALQNRVERLLAEQHFQHSLDLAKTLHRVTPTAHTADLLVRAALGRAGQLSASNYQRDAATILSSVAAFAQAPEQVEGLALALAECGQVELALRVSQPLASSILRGRILGSMADAAIRGCALPTACLPPDFQAHRDLIVKAFSEVAAGQDEQARATLAGIGLTSPFLEWKVLIRGLAAYYQNDDAKALENWQRLDARRLPARLAAPFRQAIDPTFRQAQPQEAQAQLHNLYERLQGSALSPRLRQVQQSLADPRHLAQAFRQAEGLLPALQAEAPHLRPRLAACFYWAIVDHGYPEDLKRYQRVFRASPEDPELNRMEALALERRGDLAQANDAWQCYEKGVAQRAALLPPGHADRLRALIWQHMAANAAQMRDNGMPIGFNGFGGRGKPMGLSAENCYKRSLELAPDQLEVHFALVHFYMEERKLGKALQAAKRLLKQFPDHVPTLELSGDLSLRKSSYRDAIDFFRRAVQASPLTTQLRRKLGLAQAGRASELSMAGKYENARSAFQAAVAMDEGDAAIPLLCGWAGMEFEAGEAARAEELLQRAAAHPGAQLAVAFAMLVLAIRKKLGKPHKARFEADVKHWLSQPPTAASARGLAAHFAAMRNSAAKYVGQKTHEKMVLAYLDKAVRLDFTEPQLVDVCAGLQEMQAAKHLRKYFALGQQRFPGNPRFYLAEIDYNLSLSPGRANHFKTKSLLDRVRQLAAGLPPGERTALLQEVQEREDELTHMFPFPFGGFFGGDPMDDFWPGDEFDDDFDDDDDWED
jgi:tetratricopeptide (TPR) repeat protein